jgi:hypothetical protein
MGFSAFFKTAGPWIGRVCQFTMYNKQIAEQFFSVMSADFPIIKILILDAIG